MRGVGCWLASGAGVLMQLESWEAAIKSALLPSFDGKMGPPIEVAKLLGWAAGRSGTRLIELREQGARHNQGGDRKTVARRNRYQNWPI